MRASSQLLIALCAPVFLTLIGAEYFIARHRGVAAYRSLSETLTNLSCGVGQQLVDLFLNVPVLLGYVALQKGIPKIVATPVSLALLFVLIDFIYYSYHRLSHHVPLLWAVHQVHHQSEEFNFSVGIRQAWFHKVVSFPIYVAPALLGFKPEVYVPVAALHAVLQTWTHTELLQNPMRAISWLLVVPYTHRVHHGANRMCVNRNFGGIFSVWDRLFGSHREFTGVPVYGIADSAATWDPLEANLAPVRKLGTEVLAVDGWRRRLAVLFLPGSPSVREFPHEPEIQARPGPKIALYTLLMTPAIAFFGVAPGVAWLPKIMGTTVFLFAFSAFGRRLERQP